jgi:TetR/AcrR family transcriptional regulator, transcriptional repressor for nem operon
MEIFMAKSQAHKAESRRAIVDAAARLFRENGVDGVSVAAIMDAAGLTHGGFPRHFDSKQDLLAEALKQAVAASARVPALAGGDLGTYAATYLRPEHRDAAGEGCVFAALGTELSRAPAAVRHVLTQAMAQQFNRFAASAPGDDPEAQRAAAIGSWAAMVGAMVLARIADSPALSDEILQATQRFLCAAGDDRD